MKRPTQTVRMFGIASVALVLSGCATVMHTPTQAVTVRSEPPGAKVFVDDVDTGKTTPMSVRLQRVKQGTTLRVEQEGARPATIKLRRSVSGWVAGNAVLTLLAPGGVAADYLSGSLYKLSPEAVLVDFPDPVATSRYVSRLPVVTTSGIEPVTRSSASWFYLALGSGGLLGGERDLDCPHSDRNSRIGGAIGASFMKGGHLISVRVAGQDQSLIHGDFPFSTTLVSESVSDFGVLYGRATRGRAGLASASVGLAYVAGDYSCSDGGWFSTTVSQREFATIGIPVQVQLHPKAFSRFGLGIFGFGNLNAERSFASVALAFSVGLLR